MFVFFLLENSMNFKLITATVFGLSILFGNPTVYAQTSSLDSRTNVKVMKAKRLQAMKSNKYGGDDEKVSNGCGGVEIGNVSTAKNARATAPRENTVVVTGDVIVVPGRNCDK